MYTGHTKTTTNFYLEIGSERIKFRAKSEAIKFGKLAIRINKNVRLIEEYLLWWLQPDDTKILDRQEFDRTVLLGKMKIK